MYLLNILVFLIYYPLKSTQHADFFNRLYGSWTASSENVRLHQLMRAYYEEAHVRVVELNPMRFMYEESPHYEMGYVTCEILERYRKLVETAQRPFIWNGTTLFEMVKHLEVAQKLSFEIYHLVGMVHEIPRKYRYIKEFKDFELVAGPEAVAARVTGRQQGKKKDRSLQGYVEDKRFALQKQMDEIRKQRERERRRQQRKYRKLREAFLEGKIGPVESPPRKPANKYWPRDYGWEMQYWW